MLDSTEVVLALPVIDKDLGLSEAGLQWVQNAYLLMLAATVITCGRLGDILGRRRVYIGGVSSSPSARSSPRSRPARRC